MAEESREIATPDPQGAGSLLGFIAQAVSDPNIDVAKLEALLRMKREVVGDDAKAQFNRDYIAMQEHLPTVSKTGELKYPVDKKNPDGAQKVVAKYAKLEHIDREIRPILLQHGFGVSYTTAPRTGDGGGLTVICILRHCAGHSTETPMPVPLDTSGGKNNIQGMGSALTYGRRYALCAALNIQIEGDDDDGKLGGMQFITPEQVKELEDLIEKSKTELPRFLQTMGVARLENIEAGGLAPARNMLLAKVNKKVGA